MPVVPPSTRSEGDAAVELPPPKGFGMVGRSTLVALALVLAGLVFRWAPHGLQASWVDGHVTRNGVRGELLFVIVAAAACAVGMPRQAVAFAGGYAWGAPGGLLAALAAQTLGCLLDFGWARLLGRDWVAGRMRGRLARLNAFLAAHPFRAVLVLRLLPVGNNLLLNLLAGVSRVRLAPFLLASVLGYVPQTLVFALLGSGVRVTGWVQGAVGVALFAASAALGVALLKANRRLPLADVRDGADVAATANPSRPPGNDACG